MEDLFAQDDFEVVKPSLEDNQPLFVPEDEFPGSRVHMKQIPNNDDAEIDDFDDFEFDDEFSSTATANMPQTATKDTTSTDITTDEILGLDSVSLKTRKKLVVLNESHLLSNDGLPYVKANFHKRVKFRSSTKRDPKTNTKRVSFNTEYENAKNLLLFYQLWAHKVYSKANFKDFLKLCYTKKSINKQMLIGYRRQSIQSEIDKFFNLDNHNEGVEEAKNAEKGSLDMSQSANSQNKAQDFDLDLSDNEFVSGATTVPFV